MSYCPRTSLQLLAAFFALGLAAIAMPSTIASAAPTGPVYPVPGGPGSGHGGSSCLSTATYAAGPGGAVWTLGGGLPGVTPAECPTSGSEPPDFDTSRFAALYWGADNRTAKRPQLAMDGDLSGGNETLSFRAGDSNLADGVLVWQGSTSMAWCVDPGCNSGFNSDTVDTRMRLTFTTADPAHLPVALVSPDTVGIADPVELGGVASVYPSLPRVRATIEFLAKWPAAPATAWQPAQSFYNSYHHPATANLLKSSFDGAFWYVNRAPLADFSFDAPALNVPVTFTATTSDPDGAVAGLAWDLNGDGQYSEGTNTTVQWSYGAGSHSPSLEVTDDEGATTVVSHSFTLTAPAPAGPGGGSTPSTPADTVAPRGSVKVPKQRLATAVKKGLRGTVASNEAGSARFTLTLDRKLAKRMRIKSVVGTARSSVQASVVRRFTVKLSKTAARKLRHRKSAKFQLTTKLSDAAGNASTIKTAVTLR